MAPRAAATLTRMLLIVLLPSLGPAENGLAGQLPVSSAGESEVAKLLRAIPILSARRFIRPDLAEYPHHATSGVGEAVSANA
jgi:hypothetical protein